MEPSMGTTSRTQLILLFFFVALSFLLSFCICSDPIYLGHICPDTIPLFSSNSTYQSNLKTLLSSLSSNATFNSNNSYSNATVGQNRDTVYGLYYCTGYVTFDVCSNCVNFAAVDLPRRCRNRKISYIWYNECMLRYSYLSFFSTVSVSPSFMLYNPHNISDPTRFSKLLGDTMDEAATEASPKLERFAIKEANFTNSQTLYCMVQCSPDLSGKDCNSCLVGIIAELPSSFNGLQGGRILNPSCNIRFEMYRFFPVTASALSPTHNLLPPPPPGNGATTASPPSNRTTIPENEGNFSKKIVAIVVPIVVAGVILFSVLLYCFLIRKKKQDPSKENGGNTIEAESLQFDFSTVLTATDNFADVNKIGEGGFGEVFKGKFPNGQEIAVKRLSRYSRQGAEEFKNEVLLVAKLQHRNLVRLLGFCLEGEEKILIYEFVPNKSLDYALFNPENCVQLDWQSRYKIISGIARGLLYLHEDSRLRIIHRDLKASNILLDWEMNPQISDFGTARIFGVDQTQARTNRIIGTYGYMPPEYVIHGQFSAKSDVFSYGVIVLEIVSGKKNGSLYETDSAESLMSHAWRHWTAGTAFELIDPIMRENCSRSEIMRCIHIGLLCVQEDVADRPTMASVVLMLNSFSVTLMSPSQPAFFVRSRMDSDQSKSRSIPLSANEASISELEAR
ncbi:cysteine-rich receptor-like protein kinase 10 isoform X2 [Macadamia integrifolia]|uniref:cysteine-rich receptor-like protein kinase 10 isoform X2 n=1 Tax=Macadamia integrifolia TaxID=60698 RepID=UPI001C532FF7|nr:cysteine-rich receptor-like protein kinase 10 isoform X2 [Macadamia integrifolia]